MAESKLFYAWITLIGEWSAEQMAAKLVRRNWKVRSAVAEHDPRLAQMLEDV